MSEHCAIPPSSAHRWVRCALSPLMAAMFPQLGEDTEDAAEGVAAHELAAQMVNAYARAGLGFPIAEKVIGSPMSNGVIVTEDMYDGALIYADDIKEVMVSAGVFGGPNFRVEQRLPIPRIHPLQFGTPDMSIFHAETLHLYLWDFKFGHRLHEAFENWQCIDYSAGLLDDIFTRYPKLGATPGIADQRIKITMRIVQPRGFHRDGPVRSWSVTASDLRGYYNRLESAAAAVFAADPQGHAGEWCRDCAGRHTCETLKQETYGAMDYIGSSTPELLNPEQLGIETYFVRRMAKMFEARLKGLEAHAESLLRQGQSVPFSSLEPGKGREVWAKPLEQVFAMGDLLGKELRKTAAITPKQARGLGIDDAMVKAFSENKEAGLKLVPDNGSKARRVFSK